MTSFREQQWPAREPSPNFAERTVDTMLASALKPRPSRRGSRTMLYLALAALFASGSALAWSHYHHRQSGTPVAVVDQPPPTPAQSTKLPASPAAPGVSAFAPVIARKAATTAAPTKAIILGAPTAADYDPNDPNPGMLDATVRTHYLKLNGAAPNGNACTGDGGAPLIINKSGQDVIAGTGMWTGLWCENYQIMTRLDPYLPFLDISYQKGGQATVISRLDCVVHNDDGSLRAQFDYKNNNGVNVTVPYGTANSFALDTTNARPTLFLTGDHSWAFGVNIPPKKQLDWKLSPTNSPTTELKVDASSPSCAANDLRIGCDKYCRAGLAVPACPADSPRMTQDQCITSCTQMFGMGCDAESTAYNKCVAGLSKAASNWQCYSGLADPQPSDSVCVNELTNLYNCYGI